MKKTMVRSLSVIGMLILPLLVYSQDESGSEKTADENPEIAAIKKASKSYLDAFHDGDAAAAAAHWHEEGEFVTAAGEVLKGRKAIEESFKAYFEEFPGVKLQVERADLNFISPGVAVGYGTVIATYGDGEVTQTEFEIVHAKRDGGWKFDRIAEANIEVPRSHYDQLKELEWMIGNWVDDDGLTSIQISAKWTTNSNFITRSFTVISEDQVTMQGTQIIGWDPSRDVIRSWVFDSDGGFGVGAWTRKDNEWTVTTRHVLEDGSSATAINVYKYIDDSTFSFRSTGRSIDGSLMPNIPETTIVRQ